MKKIFTLFITIACILGILCANFPVNVYADEPSITDELDVLPSSQHYSYLNEAWTATPNNNNVTFTGCYTSWYFNNLTYNYGVNYKGSCGYVAMAMILSYYDTCLNDDIIPEQYDINSVGDDTDILARRNSPGVLRDIIQDATNPSNATYGSSMSNQSYFEHMVSLSNVSLHSKLISIAGNLGYYSNNASLTTAAGSNIYMRRAVFNAYLTDVVGLASHQYFYNISYNETSDEVREFTISQITAGKPVLLSIENEETDGRHAVVAYDYNILTDEIFCHFGWGANKTHVTPESEGFYKYNNAMVLNINLQHEHTNNYVISSMADNTNTLSYHCYDDEDLTVFTHHCNFFVYYNSPHDHEGFCRCGNSCLAPHTFDNNVCLECGFIHNHTYYYTPFNSTHHKSTCECGQEILEPHVLRANVGGGLISRCIFCNAPVITSPLTLLSHQITYVSANGSYILPDGIIVLVDQDIEAFLAGTLTFYNRYTQIM